MKMKTLLALFHYLYFYSADYADILSVEMLNKRQTVSVWSTRKIQSSQCWRHCYWFPYVKGPQCSYLWYRWFQTIKKVS